MTASTAARSLRRLLVACLALLTLAACDSSDPEEERIGVSGHWVGTLVSTRDSVTVMLPVDMTLDDNVSRVTGSGTVQLPDETLEFLVVTGLFSFPDLSLTLQFDRPPQGMISGIVSRERDFIDATFSGPNVANGRVEFSLVMQRAE